MIFVFSCEDWLVANFQNLKNTGNFLLLQNKRNELQIRSRTEEKYQTFKKECLSLIFNSIIFKMQVEKLSGGAIIAHLKPSDFEKFKIPHFRYLTFIAMARILR